MTTYFSVSLLLELFVSHMLLSIMRIRKNQRVRGMAALSLSLFPFLPQGTDCDLFLCELFLPIIDIL
jgi:hypothetical protein